jgi:hypothetical protein
VAVHRGYDEYVMRSVCSHNQDDEPCGGHTSGKIRQQRCLDLSNALFNGSGVGETEVLSSRRIGTVRLFLDERSG